MVNDNNTAVPALRRGVLAPRMALPPAALARRILVVDDDPDLRDLLSLLLLGAGYRVTCAEDGEAGWDALCASSYDAVITDNDMPRLTGLELLRRIRAGPLRLPVILISGAMPWHDAHLAQLLPPGLAMQKPFALADLLASVRDTFGCPLYADARPRKNVADVRRSSHPSRVAGFVA
jgi:CheY-like chemotaxis protein